MSRDSNPLSVPRSISFRGSGAGTRTATYLWSAIARRFGTQLLVSATRSDFNALDDVFYNEIMILALIRTLHVNALNGSDASKISLPLNGGADNARLIRAESFKFVDLDLDSISFVRLSSASSRQCSTLIRSIRKESMFTGTSTDVIQRLATTGYIVVQATLDPDANRYVQLDYLSPFRFAFGRDVNVTSAGAFPNFSTRTNDKQRGRSSDRSGPLPASSLSLRVVLPCAQTSYSNGDVNPALPASGGQRATTILDHRRRNHEETNEAFESVRACAIISVHSGSDSATVEQVHKPGHSYQPGLKARLKHGSHHTRNTLRSLVLGIRPAGGHPRALSWPRQWMSVDDSFRLFNYIRVPDFVELVYKAMAERSSPPVTDTIFHTLFFTAILTVLFLAQGSISVPRPASNAEDPMIRLVRRPSCMILSGPKDEICCNPLTLPPFPSSLEMLTCAQLWPYFSLVDHRLRDAQIRIWNVLLKREICSIAFHPPGADFQPVITTGVRNEALIQLLQHLTPPRRDENQNPNQLGLRVADYKQWRLGLPINQLARPLDYKIFLLSIVLSTLSREDARSTSVEVTEGAEIQRKSNAMCASGWPSFYTCPPVNRVRRHNNYSATNLVCHFHNASQIAPGETRSNVQINTSTVSGSGQWRKGESGTAKYFGSGVAPGSGPPARIRGPHPAPGRPETDEQREARKRDEKEREEDKTRYDLTDEPALRELLKVHFQTCLHWHVKGMGWAK
ncbi:hypothetical protein DFH09DRAFT_1090338 [Mycena vulgaris]|nr:hypothetical protein DFH09DRAFT_1090338 [Mycena vulgaris]